MRAGMGRRFGDWVLGLKPPDGSPAIAYFDRTNQALKFAPGFNHEKLFFDLDFRDPEAVTA